MNLADQRRDDHWKPPGPEAAIAARGVIAALASIRPSLKDIAQRICDADDRGANRIFAPVMKIAEGVLRKLRLST